MSINPERVSEQTLAAMIASGAVIAVSAVESGNGKFALKARTKQAEITLRSHREDVRTFASLDTLRRYCRDKLGVARFEVIGELAG